MPNLCSNAFRRLFVSTSQLTKDRREQTLRLDTIQLALIQKPAVLFMHHVTSYATRYASRHQQN